MTAKDSLKAHEICCSIDALFEGGVIKQILQFDSVKRVEGIFLSIKQNENSVDPFVLKRWCSAGGRNYMSEGELGR